LNRRFLRARDQKDTGQRCGKVQPGSIVAARSYLEAALSRYDRERRPFGDWIVERGRRLGACIGARRSRRTTLAGKNGIMRR